MAEPGLKPGSLSRILPFPLLTLARHFPSSKPQFPHLWHRSSPPPYRVAERLAKWDQGKHWEQCLAHRKCAVNVRYADDSDDDGTTTVTQITMMSWCWCCEINAFKSNKVILLLVIMILFKCTLSTDCFLFRQWLDSCRGRTGPVWPHEGFS